MKIVLVQDGTGQKASELSYESPVVKVGRDSGQCQLAFPQDKYPMVSRIHAEFRHHQGQWFIIDNSSTYGTYLNGYKVTGQQKIEVGSTVQFGLDGPMTIIVVLEADAYVPTPPAQQQIPQQQYQPQPQIPEQRPPAPPVQQQPIVPQTPPPVPQNNPPSAPQSAIPSAPMTQPRPANMQLPSHVEYKPQNQNVPELEFVSAPGKAPFKIVKSPILMGRDPGCDIVLESTATMVSRRHAQIAAQSGGYVLVDNQSFNGTLLNGQRISSPTPLYHNDQIQLGPSGPILRFKLPGQEPPAGGSDLPGQRSVASDQQVSLPSEQPDIFFSNKTMAISASKLPRSAKKQAAAAESQLLMHLGFGSKQELTIGRDESNDIKLDGLQISNKHARLVKTNSGVVIEDLNSTNGVYVNGQRVSRHALSQTDAAQIGSFSIRLDQAGNIGVFDSRSRTRIDAVNIVKEVRNRGGSGKLRLLDGVSLSIQPNEFVGLLGPSGAGKSTLMDAMNGMRPASSGNVLINNLDLYQHLDSLKQAIGYVPQDDIIHRELTVYRTLFYVAKLRLSGDVSRKEIDQIIEEVLDVTGLAERRDVPVSQLSGGQRKRVSIAVELITKPSVIFLDEPTSGLDPSTEEKIMKLFRQIAESGRTVVLTTHAMENVKLFDKIVVLMRGKLVFYGKPDEALKHTGAKSFKDLYDKIEEPIEQGVAEHGEANRKKITDRVAEDWKQKFLKTAQYKANVYEPLKQIQNMPTARAQKKRRLGIFGAIRQWATLSRRYGQVLFRDKLNLFILFAQAPVIAILTALVVSSKMPRDSIYFVLSLVAIWFGISVAAREIIRERAIYNRERMVNLGLLPYLGSKFLILGGIVGIQCLCLFVPLKFLDLVGLMKMPGEMFGIPQFWAMLLTAGVGIALGLLVSALVKTSEMATSLVPLILIPQILFSGLFGVPSGVSKVVGLAMPATWSFDTIKRFSTLDTLEEEGAEPNGTTKGLGLYKFIEKENDKIITDAKQDIDKYKSDSEIKLKNFEIDLKSGLKPNVPDLGQPPQIPEAKKIPEDLSSYISFLHPWMNEVLNQIVLMIMFLMLVIGSLIVMRIQDIG